MVTFGLAPSSFLAMRILQQLAEDDGARYPNAQRVLREDFYLDDVLSGSNSLQEAKNLRA